VLAVLLAARAEAFLHNSNVDTTGGLLGILQSIAQRSNYGGSAFVPTILDSPLRVPIAITTVLFRPVVVEANNAQAMAAALEGSFLFVLSIARFRWIVAAIRSMRRWPYVAFAFLYSAGFILAFSSVPNFGLLVRQRAQLLPMYLLLLCVLPNTAGQHGAATRDPTIAAR
jgi:hypothetical protein